MAEPQKSNFLNETKTGKTFEERRRNALECSRLRMEICEIERRLESLRREQDVVLSNARQTYDEIRRLSQESLFRKKIEIVLQTLGSALSGGILGNAIKLAGQVIGLVGTLTTITSIERQIILKLERVKSLMRDFDEITKRREHLDHARGMLYGQRRKLSCEPDFVVCR